MKGTIEATIEQLKEIGICDPINDGREVIISDIDKYSGICGLNSKIEVNTDFGLIDYIIPTKWIKLIKMEQYLVNYKVKNYSNFDCEQICVDCKKGNTAEETFQNIENKIKEIKLKKIK